MRKCIIEKTPDGYKVSDYINADGSAEIVHYSTIEEVEKLLPVLSQGASGMSKDAEIAIMDLDDFGAIERVQYIAPSKVKTEAIEVAVATQFSDIIATQISDFKTDLNSKTGYVEKVKPEEPKDDTPPVDPGVVVTP